MRSSEQKFDDVSCHRLASAVSYTFQVVPVWGRGDENNNT
jgi:hypothetical protein